MNLMPVPRAVRRSAVLATAAGLMLAGLAPATAALAAGPGTWTPAGALATPRYDQVAARLADGRVLVAGGLTSWVDPNGFVRTSVLASAELYSPATGTWAAAGTMASPRYYATATTLTDGRILVAGGSNGYASGELNTTEIYNPATGKWAAGATMAYNRFQDLAVRLADGRVLVAGQRNVATQGDAAPTAEIYDPKANKWTTTSATGASSGLGAAGLLLPDGRVLTTLGMSALYSATGGPDVYTPATGKWSRLPVPPTALGNSPRIALLPNGHVLFAGGTDFGYISDYPTNVVEELDPVTGTWTVRPSTSFVSPANGGTLTTLTGGKILASGGDAANQADEIYDPATSTWTTVAGQNRAEQTVTALTSGQALTAGGYANGSTTQTLATTALFQP